MSLLTRAVLALAHGLWVWHTPQVLGAPHGAEHLRDFCRQQGITEVYVSFSPDVDLAPLVVMLHGARIRVEALLSSTDADEAGPHREKLLGKVRAVIQYNARHQDARFDGIHLDIEPQQRAENKGPGNLAYLPGLVDAYRAVRHESDAASLGVDADIFRRNCSRAAPKSVRHCWRRSRGTRSCSMSCHARMRRRFVRRANGCWRWRTMA